MATNNSAKAKDFDFSLTTEFAGYDSSRDRTNIAPGVLVRGSQNVYKRLSGTIAVRQGQKRRGVANATLSGISSEYVWNTSWGATYVLLVSDNTLYAVLDDVWYPLQTGLSSTRYVFDKWWDNSEKKDRALFVHGTSQIESWSGGLTTLSTASGTVTSISATPTFHGTGYSISDLLTITTGGTGATVRVTGLAGGQITAVELVSSGTGYTTGAGKATSGGTGTGATIEILTVASPTSTTLTKTNASVSWAQAGFSTTSGQKSIRINGTDYTYTGGETTATLTGVSPDPSGEPNGSTVIQNVFTVNDKPAVGARNDFIKVINNMAYVGSYTSRLIYISSSTDYTDYTVPTPRAPGDPELVTLDGTARGIGVRQGNAYVGFGSGSWAIISFSTTTDPTTGGAAQATKVDVKPVANLQAPLAHEFIDTVGDSLVYLAQDHQVRTFGDFTNLFTPGYPSFSQEIATELLEQDFTGGGLRCIGEYTYVTAPKVGRTYLYQVRQTVDAGGQVVAERLWHSPFIWNVTRIDEINGDVVGFSNSNPQIYSLWDTGQWHDDSPSDEHIPYECVMAMGYQNLQTQYGQRRQGLQSFDKYYTEGYITQGTPLNLTINYDWNGATATSTVAINSDQMPVYLFTPNSGSLPSLGDSSLGDEPLGDATDDLSNGGADTLIKFRNITSLNIRNVFDYQAIFSSNSADAQWEMLAIGSNSKQEQEQDATFIINKIRRT